MNCLRIILDMFALTKANIFDPFADKIDQSQSLNIAKVGTEMGKRIFTIRGQNSSSSSEVTIVGSSSKKGAATVSVLTILLGPMTGTRFAQLVLLSLRPTPNR